MTEDTGPDPLVAAVTAWIAANAKRAAAIRRWQRLESKLFDNARALEMRCDVACRSNMPEAQAMRALNQDIEAAFRELEAEATRLAGVNATSLEGALSKIRLGLEVQGPFDWRPNALELLQDGLAELRELVPLPNRSECSMRLLYQNIDR